MKKDKKVSEELQQSIKVITSHCDQEDVAVRERQIRTWRRLKLFWEGFQRVWYSETAHDWRIWDEQNDQNTDQGTYDKPINVFRAYLESIIAALSVTVPPVKCYPDDADNPLDLLTAKAGDKISGLVYQHNDVPLLWLHSLFVYSTEGMVASYTRPVCDEKFGTYDEDKTEKVTENHKITQCPLCGNVFDDQVQQVDPAINDKLNQQVDKFNPDDSDVQADNLIQNEQLEDMCPNCQNMIVPQVISQDLIVEKIVGKSTKPKARILMDCFGGLNVKVPNYARKQEECPYLVYSFEEHYACALEKYSEYDFSKDEIKKITSGNNPGAYTQYEQWGRLSPQYQGEYPLNVVTEKHYWIRPALYNILKDDADTKDIRKKFPDGCHVIMVNDVFIHAENSCLDDEWTLTYNPLSNYLHHDPLGMLLVSVQEITNDLVSFILQTIEHGVPIAFADPAVLNFKAFEQTEVVPGGIFPANAKTGKNIGDGFYELRPTTLSAEVMPFAESIQSMGQMASGALPSIFGGQIQGAGGDTASGYSMSKSGALQRLQNTWKIFTLWWKNIFGKVIPMAIEQIHEDEKDVQRDKDGNFFNVFIRRAELQGKIGKIELEANENLPLTFSQKRDVVMQLLNNANQQIMQLISSPENLEVLKEAIGLDDIYVPGEDDRIAEYEEIQQLLASEPMPDASEDPQDAGVEHPTVNIDPIFDNHAIRFEIIKNWAVSEAGRQAKIDNPNGYRNVLLHGYAHYQQMQHDMMQQQMMMQPPPNNTPREKTPKGTNMVKGDQDVQTIQ